MWEISYSKIILPGPCILLGHRSYQKSREVSRAKLHLAFLYNLENTSKLPERGGRDLQCSTCEMDIFFFFLLKQQTKHLSSFLYFSSFLFRPQVHRQLRRSRVCKVFEGVSISTHTPTCSILSSFPDKSPPFLPKTWH